MRKLRRERKNSKSCSLRSRSQSRSKWLMTSVSKSKPSQNSRNNKRGKKWPSLLIKRKLMAHNMIRDFRQNNTLSRGISEFRRNIFERSSLLPDIEF
ncbi:hypothetical protein CDAR_207481 [Caerostris darwini]|uniref:Uncharacterized protein n=1 Tax=Caerostris darwini TaxID=1538125 RepID=A0AAV4VHL3_9ARAC|nr:hypothetical protein CDAR_207481 [Caerostris darwini]